MYKEFNDKVELRKTNIILYMYRVYVQILFGALIYLLVTYFLHEPPVNIGIKLIIVLISILVLTYGYLSRRNRSSNFYIWLVFVCLQTILSILLITFYGSTEGLAYIALTTVIYSSSVVISYRVGMRVTMLSIVMILGISYTHHLGYNPIAHPNVDSSYINTLVLCFFLWVNSRIAMIGYQEIEGSYAYALKYSKELEEINSNLDHMVDERSIALEDAWKEKVRILERNAMLGRISGAVLHDVKTPLSSMTLSVDILRSELEHRIKLPDDSLITQSIGSIENAYHQIIDIVEDSEGLMKNQESGREFSVNKQIESVVKLVRSSSTNSGIKILVEQRSSEIKLFGIPSLFFRIILNLVLNSVEELRGSALQREGMIAIRCSRVANELLVQIHDNGAGIRKADLERVFEEGYSRKYMEKHYGLGLHFVKGMVTEYFGGDVTIESEVGKYTKVNIRFPLTNAKL